MDETQMTVISSKRTGEIKCILSGVQTMDVMYGVEAEDYKLIWSENIFDYDPSVIARPIDFLVSNGVLMIKNEIISKYQVAQ